MDRLRQFNLQPISTPENVPRLFDLVKPKNPKFSNAFYSVLRDTLVAQNLKQANNVAYGKKRFRVVTVDGKLIDISGTMSGGGNHVAKGLMKLGTNQSDKVDDYTPEEVDKIEREGMGSMKLYMSLPPKEIISTIFVSECSFKDSDGIDVLASLYLDQDHEICEVDIWKADFSPLIRISSDISL